MLRMFWILDGGQELRIAWRTSDIIGWGGTGSSNTQRIKPLGIGLGHEFDLDEMPPAVAKVIFVDKTARRVRQGTLKGIFSLIQHIQIFQISGPAAEDFLAELEA